MRKKVEEELERLEKEGIIRKRQFAEWATPIVPILKDDGAVRICGDYKVTANQAVIVDPHPIPRIEDIRKNVRRYLIHKTRSLTRLLTVATG